MLALALFLFTGFSGLIYEVLWTRMFSLVLGTTTFAVPLRSSAPIWADSPSVPGGSEESPTVKGPTGSVLYGWLELAVGLYAFLLPAIISLSNEVYIALWPSVESSLIGQVAVRVTLVAITLFIPTVLMGGSLPALSRYLVRDHIVSGRSVGLLYGLNTLGCRVRLPPYRLLLHGGDGHPGLALHGRQHQCRRKRRRADGSEAGTRPGRQQRRGSEHHERRRTQGARLRCGSGAGRGDRVRDLRFRRARTRSPVDTGTDPTSSTSTRGRSRRC